MQNGGLSPPCVRLEISTGLPESVPFVLNIFGVIVLFYLKHSCTLIETFFHRLNTKGLRAPGLSRELSKIIFQGSAVIFSISLFMTVSATSGTILSIAEIMSPRRDCIISITSSFVTSAIIFAAS